MDPSTFGVLTASSHPEAAAFDAEQKGLGFRIERVAGRVSVPTPATVRRIRATARDLGASLVVLDPALPLGLAGPLLGDVPYALVLHGAEVTVPARLPGSRQALANVLSRSVLAVCGGGYPAAEARAWPATTCHRWWRSLPGSTSNDCDPSRGGPASRRAPGWVCPSTGRWW